MGSFSLHEDVKTSAGWRLKKVPSRRSFAFEKSAKIFSLRKKNARTNRLDWISTDSEIFRSLADPGRYSSGSWLLRNESKPSFWPVLVIIFPRFLAFPDWSNVKTRLRDQPSWVISKIRHSYWKKTTTTFWMMMRHIISVSWRIFQHQNKYIQIHFIQTRNGLNFNDHLESNAMFSDKKRLYNLKPFRNRIVYENHI